MKNLHIQLDHPWLLLLLIPAVLFTLIPYFRLSKRYRRTRNRITSIVLHLITLCLAILTLCGFTLNYQVVNKENEIIFLVDVSESETDVAQRRDEFLEFAIQESSYDGYKVGVVAFGFDQVYAAPLSYEIENLYDQYLTSMMDNPPDITATNIADALEYTMGLFTNPKTSKIVLLTDGKETDDNAMLVIRSMAAKGIKVDIAEFSEPLTEFDAQISNVEMPEYHMVCETEYKAEVIVQSNEEMANVRIEVYDNGEICSTQYKDLNKGTQTIMASLIFHEEGLHELSFVLSVEQGDKVFDNNIYYSYYYLENFNNVLILERMDGESQSLVEMLTAENEYKITVLNIADNTVPMDLSALCEYDQVILNNISNADLQKQNGFVELLDVYVRECGGGLFTVGGNKEVTTGAGTKAEANAYNRADLYKTLYQSMLPVEAINYTPPLGVIVLLDISGSMGESVATGGTRIDAARDCLQNSLEAMTARDHIGIMTFDSNLEWILRPTPRTYEAQILEALNTIKTKEAGGGTAPDDAIKFAAQQLIGMDYVAKRHIVVISDGGIANVEDCATMMESYYKNNNITLSFIGIEVDEMSQKSIEKLTNAAGGEEAGSNIILRAAGPGLVDAMKMDLSSTPLKEVEEGSFNPVVADHLSQSPLTQDLPRLEDNNSKLDITLDGFYGVKARVSAEVVLMGEYEVPIYAQWKYGEGMVGSFMSDLNGYYSKDFMASATGKQFVKNVINNLMPTMNIRPNDITIDLKAENYINTVSVYTAVNVADGEYLKGAIYDASGTLVADMGTTYEAVDGLYPGCYMLTNLNAANNYSRCSFVLKDGGVYRIIITKYDKDGNEMAVFDAYKTFSYSKEYDVYLPTAEDAIVYTESLMALAEGGNGKMIEDLDNPWEIFDGFITELDKEFDPRYLFMIIAIILFLLDIAVRKFKFKWPHELIREYKAKKAEQSKAQGKNI